MAPEKVMTQQQASIRIAGALCVAMLFLPILLSRCDREENLRYLEQVEQRRPSDFPSPERVADLLDPRFYAAIDAAVRDRLPFRGRVIGGVKRVELALPGNTGKHDVLVTDEGWYFLEASFGRRLGSPQEMGRALELVDDFMRRHEGGSTALRLMIVADKHSVYPERLDLAGREQARVYQQSRELVQRYFAGSRDPRVIDMASIWRAAKPTTEELLFQPGDTHHSDRGAMLMARALIDSLRPGLWREQDVVFVREEWRSSDLHNLAGLAGVEELHRIYHVERSGVELIETQWLDESEDPLRPVRHLSRSVGPELIEGRALIVHDSFIGTTLRPVLRQFFADLTYRHIDQVASSQLEEAMAEYDVVVIETTVRESKRVFTSLFSRDTAGGAGRAEEREGT